MDSSETSNQNSSKRFAERQSLFAKKVSGWVHFIFAKIFKPRSSDENAARREFILNVILFCLIAMVSVLGFFILYNMHRLGSAYLGMSFGSFFIIWFLFVVLYSVSRLGYPNTASYILIGVFFAAVTFAARKYGVSLPAAMLSYAALIMIASVLISTSAGIFVAAGISWTIIRLADFQSKSDVLPTWKTRQISVNDAIQYAIMLFLIMGIAWLSNREIEQSLKRARQSEKELKKQRDLLEIKVEERTKELKQEQSERLGQIKRIADFGRLASGLFHDLVNPLTAISLSLEKLKQIDRPEGDGVQEHLEQAFEITNRMDSFLRSAMKQIQTQQVNILFALNEEIYQVIDILNYKAKKAGVQLDFVYANVVYSYGNPVKFYQAISNLVSNAIDAYEEVGIEKEMRKVLITLHEEGAVARIEVKDWGSGISEADKKKVFEPFFTTKQPGKGTGIGLSNTKDVIEKDFEGSIAFESSIGKGSVFTIKMPIRLWK